MKSAIAMTTEIDDMSVAANELAAEITKKLSLEKASIGLVYCDADVPVAELGRRLHEKLGIDIVGLTTSATVERNQSYCDMGIVLSVMTGDDVEMAVGSTGDMQKEDYAGQIKAAYAAARSRLSDDPKLILICSPYIADLTSENYMEVLDEVSGHVPVFGGVATDHYDLQYQKTFFNGEASGRGLVFVLISGHIKPVFALEHHFGAKTERKGVITKSTGNMVERVGGKTFKEFLSDMTSVPEDELVIFQFQSTPFVMELPDYEENEQPVVRALCSIDHETGSGGFLSKMPEGSRLSLNVLQRENLVESCKQALDQLTTKMRESPDYAFSMVLISTCNARHLLMGDVKNLEGKLITEKLSGFGPNLNAMGFYGFGEMCPTAVAADGTAKNRFHNVSFAACAF